MIHPTHYIGVRKPRVHNPSPLHKPHYKRGGITHGVMRTRVYDVHMGSLYGVVVVVVVVGFKCVYFVGGDGGVVYICYECTAYNVRRTMYNVRE